MKLIADTYDISELQEFISSYLEMKKDVGSKARKDVIEVVKALKVNIIGSGEKTNLSL